MAKFRLVVSLIFLAVVLMGCGASFDASRNRNGPLNTPAGIELLQSFGASVYPREEVYIVNDTPWSVLVSCESKYQYLLQPNEQIRPIESIGSGTRREVTCYANHVDARGYKAEMLDRKTFWLGRNRRGEIDHEWIITKDERRNKIRWWR